MLYSKLSVFYFFYFALLGVMVPYLGLYLGSKGFSLLEIAQLSSILMMTKILAPNLWGAIADRYHNRLTLVRMGAIMTLLCYLGFFFVDSFWHHALVIMLFSFFWNAVLPQFEVITLFNLAEYRDRYSRVRLWGSIGFIVSVAILGALFEKYGIACFPWALLIIIVAIWLASQLKLAEPKTEADKRMVFPGFWRELCRRDILIFFVVCLLLQMSHGAYYTYFSIFLESIEYNKTQIGLLWGLGVLAEVVLFWAMHHWFARSTIKQIMMLALLLTGIRWLLIAEYSYAISILILAQCLHALSFGAMHAASIKFVHLAFSQNSQGRAQALYSSVGFGAGGASGAYLSGLIVSHADYELAFLLSAVMAFAAMALAICFRSSGVAR